MDKYRRRINAALGVTTLVGAGLFTQHLLATRPEPPRRDQAALVPEVDLYPVELTTFKAPVVGHGTVRAKNPLDIVPEVGGALVYVNENLAVGKQIKKGDLLFEIDDHTYRLRVAQAEAEIRGLEAQLARQKKEQLNLAKRLAVAQDLLTQAEKNVERERGLLDDAAGAPVEVEQAENAALKQRDVVLGYQAQVETAPHVIDETQALIDLKKSQLEEARRQVAKTKIFCPFDARVEAISAAASEVVIVGFSIATLTNMESLELPVGLEPSDLQWTRVWEFVRNGRDEGEEPPRAKVTWTVNDREYYWHGTVARLERVDEVTRTARVVIEIDDVGEHKTMNNGQVRPPLPVGVFCRVEIPAEPLANAMVVPRSALQDPTDGSAAKYVYVFEPEAESAEGLEGRLAMRHVPVLRSVNDQVLVSFDRSQLAAPLPEVDLASARCELQPGDEIILSPLPWAVEGMKLRRRDAAQMAQAPTPRPVDSPPLLGLAQVPAPAAGVGR